MSREGLGDRACVFSSFLSQGAAKRLLEELCLPLNQLLEIDAFLKKCEVPSVDPPFPVTLQAYATGIRLWRHRFQSHLATIEDQIKKQGNVTLSVNMLIHFGFVPFYNLCDSAK